MRVCPWRAEKPAKTIASDVRGAYNNGPARRRFPIRRTLRTALVAALAAPALSLAADLGRITIQSGVGEPLRAEIELVSVAPNEAQSLAARIPPPEVFWRTNIEPAPALKSIRAAVERRGQGRYVVTLRSSEPMLDPFMDLLVELTSNASRSMREYTFLLEESVARRAPPPAAARSPSDTTDAPARAARAIEPPTRAAARAGEYQVKPGDTLATIAREHNQYGVALEQMVVALYQANQDAFLEGNLNLLKVGRTLAIPDEVAALATASDDARRIVAEHRAAFERYRNRLAAAVARTAAPAGGPASQQTAGRITSDGAPPPSAAQDQLRLSPASPSKEGGAPSAARDDDIIAMQRALTEAQERISLLEKNLQDVRGLLDLKNQQLTQLQAAPRSPNTGTGGAAAAELNPPAPTGNASESSLSRSIARALAWMSIGAAIVLLPISGFVWLRTRNERRREMMLRQATGRHRHKHRRHRGERAHRDEPEEDFSS